MRGLSHSFFHLMALVSLCGFVFALAMPRGAVSQEATVPGDFEITLTSAPNLLGDPLEQQTIRIKADGSAWFSPRTGGDGPLPEASGTLAEEDVAAIWNVARENRFFDLATLYNDPDIVDGDYAEISVTANGQSHTVRTVNIRLFDFDLIALTINARVPKDRTVMYNALVEKDYRDADR